MKKFMKKWLVLTVMIMVGLFVAVTPVFADENSKNCVSTAVLGNGNEVCDDGSGSSIWNVLRTVVEILSIGVGILGVVGITVVGVQYLTAGGSEEKATKAKRRLYEIVIGLAAYAVLFGIITWLMPSYNADGPSSNISSGSSGGSGSSGNGGSSGSNTSSANKNSTSIANTFQKTAKGNTVYLDKNGEKVTGRQKINDSYYYFSKNGAMKTGWITIKNEKTGKENRYYYKDNGKQVFGTYKMKGKYNEIGKKDTWYFNNKTGALEGVDLAVPRIAQTDGESCGSTSVLMVRAYLIGKKSYTYNGGSYAWNAPVPWRYVCGVGEIFPSCLEKFGYGRNAGGEYVKESALKQLYAGKPFIFRWYGNDAVNYGYAGGYGGHFMVISGYHDGVYTIKDPAGGSVPRKSSITSRLFEQYWPTGKLTFYYLYKLK